MPDGLCQCGCGKNTSIAKVTRSARGDVAGFHVRFLRGHGGGLAKKLYPKRHSPEYRAYHDAKQRCTNPKSKKWNDYGGRGIKFRFRSFAQFFSELGLRPDPSHSLDRKKNDGHYEIGNVRWATRSRQMSNQRRSR
jgi:hypothetical protein